MMVMLRRTLFAALSLSVWLAATGILAPCVTLLCAGEPRAAPADDSASQNPCTHSGSNPDAPFVAAVHSGCCAMEIASAPEAVAAKKPDFAPDPAASAVREAPASAEASSPAVLLASTSSHPLFLPFERQPLLCVFLI
jgi:hypothetical protein